MLRLNAPLSALFTDFYELTMMQACFLHDNNIPVVFDMYFRTPPFNGGYTILAGLGELLEMVQNFRFSEEDITYLAEQKIFTPSFLNYLRTYAFHGDIWAMDEGSLCFPYEPLVRVEASLSEAQLIEGLILNTINFQSLVASKTARIVQAAEGAKVFEFGLRRAQGYSAALSASRAAYIGGASASSNAMAGRIYSIPLSGTMAHSWIMVHHNEEEAFEQYAKVYPQSSVFLIDTYDSLGSGIENAIRVGKKLQKRKLNFSVRLDSGDIEYLSKQVRKRLDEAGLPEAQIIVSNDLNELIISQLVHQNCPIDVWGVGTQLVTGGENPSLGGVYKLTAKKVKGSYQETMKLSDSPEKTSLPGRKQVYRFYDKTGQMIADLIALSHENISTQKNLTFYHPLIDYAQLHMEEIYHSEALLKLVLKAGKICHKPPSLEEIRQRVRHNLSCLHHSYKRIINPHIYKVSITEELRHKRNALLVQYRKRSAS